MPSAPVPPAPGTPGVPRVLQPVAPARTAPQARQVHVPWALEIATAWGWRLLVVAVAVYVFGFLVLDRVQVVAVPLLLAVLVAALLSPLYRGLRRARVPRYPAAGSAVAGFVLVLGLTVTVVSQQIATEIGEFGTSAGEGLQQTLAFVADLLGVSLAQVEASISEAVGTVVQQGTSLASGALTATGTATTVLAGLLLTLFAVFFYLSDGPRIWQFLVSLLPQDGRPRADVAGRRSWATLAGYVRALPVVALVDALGIGIGAAVLGVPFALPIAVITFVGAFIPLVGAIVAGALAVLVALVSEGLVDAIILLVIVLAVQQVESYVLQPLLLGRAVELHPLAVVSSITTGLVLAGIVGGVLAVPVLAMAVTFVRSLSSPHAVPALEPVDPGPDRQDRPGTVGAVGAGGAVGDVGGLDDVDDAPVPGTVSISPAGPQGPR